MAEDALPFEQLDFLYTPSRDVASDLAYMTDVLGGRALFAVEGMGARVAAVELAPGPPLLLLTDHVAGDRPILVYRVEDLDTSMKELKERGWKKGSTLEIPHGPVCSFTAPGGHRIAIYQLPRPEAANHFDGRRDF